MKIQIGEITMNRTKKYLVPCLRHYGSTFVEKIHSITKVAIGIGDIITIRSNIKLEKHIFILLDTTANIDKKIFHSVMSWIKEQDMYEEDYAFDHLSKGFLHMLVIKLPEDCYEAFETFKRGEYSKMYTPDKLKSLFNENSEQYKILVKDHNYKLTFSKALQKEYDIEIAEDEIDDKFEFDFPIKEIEEIFNTEYK